MKKKDCLDFYVIGAQKAGTTWLHRRLSQINGYNLPRQKEMHFFDRSETKYPQPPSKFNKPLPLSVALKRGYRSLMSNFLKGKFYPMRERFLYYFGKYDLAWYQAYMRLHAQKGITGDITPAYATLLTEDISLMARVAPKAKVFYIIRDPIERQWSQWRMFLDNRNLNYRVQDLSLFKEIFPNVKNRKSYLETMKNYESYFKEHFYLLFYDSILENPKALIAGVHQKLAPNQPSQLTNLNFQQKEQVSFSSEMSPDFYRFFKDCFEEEIKLLHEVIGGYCSRWYFKHYSEGAVPAAVTSELVKVESLVNLHK